MRRLLLPSAFACKVTARQVGIVQVGIAKAVVGGHSAGMRTSFLRSRADGVYLAIKLQPRASINEIGGPLGDELKIKVTAAPVDSEANQALIDLLAEKLKCSRGAVTIVRGETSRRKTIRIAGLDSETVLQRLLPR